MKGQWEERFERSCGHWRAFVDDVVYAFLDCGDLQQGFARVFCDACHSEYLLAFSCSRRGVCPSCAAKRGAIFGAFLREEILEPVPHCMWTFTIPKLLRPYFLHHRPLLGPGMVATVHTAASDLRFHPHIHALASRGGWDRAGTWHPMPYVDTRVAEELFRQKVISFLAAEGLLNEERIALLDSWKAGHTGFSAHNSVTVGADDHDGLERLARVQPTARASLGAASRPRATRACGSRPATATPSTRSLHPRARSRSLSPQGRHATRR